MSRSSDHSRDNGSSKHQAYGDHLPSSLMSSRSTRDSTPSSPVASEADYMTVSLSIPYMVLVEPAPVDVVFASSEPFRNWNDPVQQPSGATIRSFDNAGRVCKVIEQINKEGQTNASISIDMRTGKSATIIISGSATAVLDCRSRILRQYYEIGVDHVGIDTFQLLDAQGNIKGFVKDQLEAIAAYTSAAIFVTKVLDASLRPQNPSPLELEDVWKPYHILAYGDLDSIAFAKTRMALLMDEMNGLFIDRLTVPLSLHPLLAGRDQVNFQKVTQDTGTKLYTPTLFPGVHASMDEDHARRTYDEIYIVGQERNVDEAKEMIQDQMRKITVFSKDFVIQFAKVDFLLLRSLAQLEELSRTNAAFIQFPFLGAARSLVRVQCSSHIFVEKTIKSVAKLTCDIYSAAYCVHENRADEAGFLVQPRLLPPVSAIRDALEQICLSSDADITFLNCSFEVIGDVDSVKSAISQIRGLPFWPNESHQVRFRVELSVDQREFISGKKNGKTNRIMSTAHVWLRFEPFSEYNFFVDLMSANYTSALFGLQLLEEELPAEISFYVPELYHRSIIGTGGQQIQSLMRKYNVFVKFSNAFDQTSDLASISTIDNVVVRCPAKNAESLIPAKHEIQEIVKYLERHGAANAHSTNSYPAYKAPEPHSTYPSSRR